MWNWLRKLYWRFMYSGVIDFKTDIRKCNYCGNLFLVHDDSIRYKHWNISGFYEIYNFCDTGKGSCYAKFLKEYVYVSDSEDIAIYVVSE